MPTKEYINTPDVVKLTGRPSSEIIELVKSGVLPGHKTKRGWWRYEADAVNKYFGLSGNPAETAPKTEAAAKELSTALSPYKLAIDIIEHTSRCVLIVGKAGSG